MAAILFLYVETVALPFLGRSRAWQLYNSDLFGSKLKKKQAKKAYIVKMEASLYGNEILIQWVTYSDQCNFSCSIRIRHWNSKKSCGNYRKMKKIWQNKSIASYSMYTISQINRNNITVKPSIYLGMVKQQFLRIRKVLLPF